MFEWLRRIFRPYSIDDAVEACVIYFSRTRPMDRAAYWKAVLYLCKHAGDAFDWTLSLVEHPKYEACEFGADLLGIAFAQGGLDAAQRDQALSALSVAAVRPLKFNDDGRRVNRAAIVALGRSGERRALPALAHLLSTDPWKDDDLAEDAARAVAEILGHRFAREVDVRDEALALLARDAEAVLDRQD